MEKLHDPYPDGKTGPWLREPHLKNDQGLVLDSRCGKCASILVELVKLRAFGFHTLPTVRAAEIALEEHRKKQQREADLAKAKGEYGAGI